MVQPRLRVVLSLSVYALLALSNPLLPASPKLDWDAIKFVYAFGDSYSFVQGIKGRANFSFVGDALAPATPAALLTDAIVPRNTSSGGANWLEFLTGCQGGPPAHCARQLWDFAFAGADISADLLPRHHPFTVALTEQVAQWVALAPAAALPHPPGATLTAWWIGINDTGDTVGNTSITDFPAFWAQEMDVYFGAVQTAVDRGLRGAHLFLNVPPGDRAPSALGDASKAATLRQHITQFNAALAERVNAFASANPALSVLTLDAHAWFGGVLDHAGEFGFTNTTGFCGCSDPDSGFFWFDSGHPTERVHKLLAAAVEGHLRADTGPAARAIDGMNYVLKA